MRCGADGFIGNIDTVHFNAGGAAKASAKGDGREAVLGGIEIAAVLNLHAGLKLGKIEEVAAVDRQILNLFCV